MHRQKRREFAPYAGWVDNYEYHPFPSDIAEWRLLDALQAQRDIESQVEHINRGDINLGPSSEGFVIGDVDPDSLDWGKGLSHAGKIKATGPRRIRHGA